MKPWYDDGERALTWYGRAAIAYWCVAAVYVAVVIVKIVVGCLQ